MAAVAISGRTCASLVSDKAIVATAHAAVAGIGNDLAYFATDLAQEEVPAPPVGVQRAQMKIDLNVREATASSKEGQ